MRSERGPELSLQMPAPPFLVCFVVFFLAFFALDLPPSFAFFSFLLSILFMFSLPSLSLLLPIPIPFLLPVNFFFSLASILFLAYPS